MLTSTTTVVGLEGTLTLCHDYLLEVVRRAPGSKFLSPTDEWLCEWLVTLGWVHPHAQHRFVAIDHDRLRDECTLKQIDTRVYPELQRCFYLQLNGYFAGSEHIRRLAF